MQKITDTLSLNGMHVTAAAGNQLKTAKDKRDEVSSLLRCSLLRPMGHGPRVSRAPPESGPPSPQNC
jgi:hypothetical protein